MVASYEVGFEIVSCDGYVSELGDVGTEEGVAAIVAIGN